MNILVTGITGYIGSHVAETLRHEGHDVRGLSRRPPPGGFASGGPRGRVGARGGGRTGSAGSAGSASAPRPLPVIAGDALSGAGLTAALDGVEVAYYLIHSMEPTTEPTGLAAREREAAERFARAASAAGVRRIVYLGGLVPEHGPRSEHLVSRTHTEDVLRALVADTVALRASIVIGARSRSFRFLVRLVERLPLLAVPAWRTFRTAPVDERDVVAMLAAAATVKGIAGLTLDAGGPDVVSYGELIDRIAEHMLVSRPSIRFKRLTVTPIASPLAAAVAGERLELIGPLMESLDGDLLPRDDRASRMLGVRLHSLDAAIEHALRVWEESEPLRAR